jgi:lipid-A-disaccharide synthase
MIVLYRVSPLTYFIGKSVIDLKNIALANIILGERVVPELIQHHATPKNIKSEIQKYLSDQNYFNEVALKLAKIPELIGRAGAANRAAREISKFLAGNRKASTG